MHQNLAQQIPCNLNCLSSIEGARQDHVH
jgi:hypothetical protein